jgi:pyruvate/2-oxoglutarate dehydrogenase complex dihydrolipoamide acyltransferase (E2) component
MSRKFFLRFPAVSSSFTNPKVSKIHVFPGESVKRNTELIEIESEKGIIVLQSNFSGIVSEVVVKKEQFVGENDLLLIITKD